MTQPLTQADEVRMLREALKLLSHAEFRPYGTTGKWECIDCGALCTNQEAIASPVDHDSDCRFAIARAALAIEPAPEVAPAGCSKCEGGLISFQGDVVDCPYCSTCAAPSLNALSAADALAAQVFHLIEIEEIDDRHFPAMEAAAVAYRAARGTKP